MNLSHIDKLNLGHVDILNKSLMDKTNHDWSGSQVDDLSDIRDSVNSKPSKDHSQSNRQISAMVCQAESTSIQKDDETNEPSLFSKLINDSKRTPNRKKSEAHAHSRLDQLCSSLNGAESYLKA